MGDCISRQLLLDELYLRFSIGCSTTPHNWSGVPWDIWERQLSDARILSATMSRYYRGVESLVAELPDFTGHELDPPVPDN